MFIEYVFTQLSNEKSQVQEAIEKFHKFLEIAF